MIEKLKKLNDDIDKKSLGVFPFIGANTVIKLDKGLYKAKQRNYYGVTLVTNNDGQQEALLYGYYWIPENIVIYRGNILKASEGKQNLLDSLQRKGYTYYDNLPSLDTFKYEEDTEEYEIAKENFETFKERRKT